MSLKKDEEIDAAVRRLAGSAYVEVIPLRGAEDKVSALPVATPVTITCSPKFGLERTLEHTARAAAAGHRVVPHLAARQVPGKEALRDIVGRLGDLGVTDLFVIGGDAAEPAGAYSSSVDLLEALAGIDHPLTRIGVGCYPEGHPGIADDVLVDALRRKQEYAHYMVSQLCFDAGALAGWLVRLRAQGVHLPLRIGLAGPLTVRKLAELSVRIGVGSSLRFLTKQHGLMGRLLPGSAYRPEELLEQICRELSPEEAGVEGVHLFSFNQVEATAAWQRRVLGAEPGPYPASTPAGGVEPTHK